MKAWIFAVVAALSAHAAWADDMQTSDTKSSSSDRPPKIRFPYPPDALLACLEGRSIVDIAIGADGIPEHVTLVQSSGSGSLDAAAQADFIKTRWKPATLNGKPVDSHKRMAINWSLRGAKCVPGEGPSHPLSPEGQPSPERKQD